MYIYNTPTNSIGTLVALNILVKYPIVR